PDEIVAFTVRGDSMLPVYRPGDAILVWRDQRLATENYVGEEAAVRTADGARYLKEIRRARRSGRFDLYSHNATPIENVRLAWVGEIYLIVKASQLRRVEREQRTAAARRAKARDHATEGMDELPLPERKRA
ncbi:MAG TPA: S24 family peptidase, partial [Beijerinckiaceae bacterium]|nr:S24 family peptidase [Beijerinckiaceae bacterium]